MTQRSTTLDHWVRATVAHIMSSPTISRRARVARCRARIVPPLASGKWGGPFVEICFQDRGAFCQSFRVPKARWVDAATTRLCRALRNEGY